MTGRRIVLVSHLASAATVTGAERSLLNLAGALARAGHRVALLAPGEGRSVTEARAVGLEVAVRPWPRLFLASWRAAPPATLLRAARFLALSPQLRGLGRALDRLRPEVVLVNTLVNVGAAWAARRRGLKVVWRVAEIPGPGIRRHLFRHAASRLADRVVAVSAAVARALEVARAEVVPTGVPLPSADEVEAARAELRRRLGLAGAAVVVGHVSQLRPHKGQAELVAAARRLGRLEGVTFAILGATEDDPRYVRRLAAAGRELGDRLRFAGFLPGPGRAAAAVDVLAFTSVAPDPFPLAMLEAMAAGVPVVAFRGGGVDEAVVDGETGILVATGDVAALAAALGRLGGDAELRRQLGEAGRRRVSERFRLDEAARAYERILVEVADRTVAGGG